MKKYCKVLYFSIIIRNNNSVSTCYCKSLKVRLTGLSGRSRIFMIYSTGSASVNSTLKEFMICDRAMFSSNSASRRPTEVKGQLV